MAHMLSKTADYIDLGALKDDVSIDSLLRISINVIIIYENNISDRKRFCNAMKNEYHVSFGNAIKVYRYIGDITQYFKNENPNQVEFHQMVKNKYNISYTTMIQIYQHLTMVYKQRDNDDISISNVAESIDDIDLFVEKEGELIEPSQLNMLSHVIECCKNKNPPKKEFCNIMKNVFNVSYGSAIKAYRDFVDIREYLQNMNSNRKQFCEIMKYKYNVSYGEAIKSYKNVFIVYQQREGKIG